MIGGVLVERTVNEVLPALEQNKEQVIIFDLNGTFFLSMFIDG